MSRIVDSDACAAIITAQFISLVLTITNFGAVLAAGICSHGDESGKRQQGDQQDVQPSPKKGYLEVPERCASIAPCPAYPGMDLFGELAKRAQQITLPNSKDQAIFQGIYSSRHSWSDEKGFLAELLLVKNLAQAAEEQKGKYYSLLAWQYAFANGDDLNDLLAEDEKLEYSKFLVMIDPFILYQRGDAYEFIAYLRGLSVFGNSIVAGKWIDLMQIASARRAKLTSSPLVDEKPLLGVDVVLQQGLAYTLRVHDKRFIPVLSEMYDSDLFGERHQRRLSGAPLPGETAEDYVRRTLAADFEREHDRGLQTDIVEALAGLGERSVLKQATEWAWAEDGLSEPGEKASREAASGIVALAYLGDIRVFTKYRAVLRKTVPSGGPYPGYEIFRALPNVVAPETTDFLLSVYNDTNHIESVRGRALTGLARMRYPEAPRLVLEAIQGPLICEEVFEAIPFLPDKRAAARTILDAIKLKRSPYLFASGGYWSEALDALADLGYPSFKERIYAFLREDYEFGGVIPRETLDSDRGFKKLRTFLTQNTQGWAFLRSLPQKVEKATERVFAWGLG